MNAIGTLCACCAIVAATVGIALGQPVAQPRLSYQDASLPVEQRITDLLSRMTIEEKIAALGTNPGVERLGVRGTRHVKGLHGLAQGGYPAGGGRPRVVPTTTLPQAIGLAMMWNPSLLRKCAAHEAHEARYVLQSPEYAHG